jgi:hypothetical protein
MASMMSAHSYSTRKKKSSKDVAGKIKLFSSSSALKTTKDIQIDIDVDLPNETNSAVIQGQVAQAGGGNEHIQTILEKLLVNAVLLPIAIKRE